MIQPEQVRLRFDTSLTPEAKERAGNMLATALATANLNCEQCKSGQATVMSSAHPDCCGKLHFRCDCFHRHWTIPLPQ